MPTTPREIDGSVSLNPSERHARVVSKSDSGDCASEGLFPAILDSLADLVAAIGSSGEILFANRAFKKFSAEISLRSDCRGSNYFELIQAVFEGSPEKQTELLSGIRRVMEGALADYSCDFPLVEGYEMRWITLRVTALTGACGGAAIVHRDSTATHKTEQEMRESYVLFQHAIEGTNDRIFMYDMNGRFVMCNGATAEALGLNSKKVIGRSIHEIFEPELARTIQEQNLLVLTTGQTLSFEMSLDTPGGKQTVLVNKGVYRNHRREIAGVFGIARDITHRKQAEELIENSERRYRHLIENSGDVVCLVAESGIILYVSPASKKVFGYEVEALVATNFFLWIHPEDLQELTRRFRELLELPGASITAEFRALIKGGSWQWMNAIATNLLHDPSVHAVVINQRNIDERKKAEMELSRLAGIIESSSDAIIGADPEGTITSWNVAANRLFGYSRKEILGQSALCLVPLEHREKYESLRAAAVRGKATMNFETVRVGKGGQNIEIALTISPIRDHARQVVGFSEIMRDVTERRRLEKEILEISDHEKERIGLDLHDDLCQHLVGISLLGNLLYQDLSKHGIKQAEDARQVTELIRNAVDHARSLARGLSPLHLADSGFMAGLEKLVTTTEKLFRIPCTFECNATVQISDPAVAIHLYRIAQEALHNAVKHSHADKVLVSLERLRGTIVVTVSDNGLGMSESKKCGQGGGLGMHTMHYRARIIGASLEFKPHPEGGTRVICRLPESVSV